MVDDEELHLTAVELPALNIRDECDFKKTPQDEIFHFKAGDGEKKRMEQCEGVYMDIIFKKKLNKNKKGKMGTLFHFRLLHHSLK